MFAVIYRWRIHPDMDAQFVDGWERVTRAIRAEWGSYGSRLHRSEDGTWVAYARWPDAATRAACVHGEVEGSALMAAAIVEPFDEMACIIFSDLLAEPVNGSRILRA